jgi:hypothetical protein
MITDMPTPEQQNAQAAGLDAALARLADVMAGVEASVFDYCGFCYAKADAIALSGPLDGIPGDLLSTVAAEVPSHWDDFANLYRKLTPRIMTLLVHDELHIAEELIAERFADVGCWHTWADDERDAMLAVCRAWWEATLNSYPRRPETHVVLSFLVTTPVPLAQWLEVWNSQPPGPADLHALDLCRWWAPEFLGGDLMLGWSAKINVTADLKPWILKDARPRLARLPPDPDLLEILALLETGDWPKS